MREKGYYRGESGVLIGKNAAIIFERLQRTKPL